MKNGFALAAVIALVLLAGVGIAQVAAPQAVANNDRQNSLDEYGNCRTLYGIVNGGESLPSEGNLRGLRLHLVNVTTDDDENVHNNPALWQVFDRRNHLVSEMNMTPGHVGSGQYSGRTYYVTTLQTSPGFTLHARWAEALFTVCGG